MEKVALFELFKREWTPYRKQSILGPVFKALEVVFDLVVPICVARMVDLGVMHHDVGAIYGLGGLMLVMAIGGFACTVVAQKMAAVVSQGIGGELREQVFDKIVTMPPDKRLEFGTPSLITRITSDITEVQVAIALWVRQLVRWPVLAVGSIICAILIDFRLGLIFLVTTPLVGLAFWVILSRVTPLFTQAQSQIDEATEVSQEDLDGVRVIRAFVETDHEIDAFEKLNAQYRDTSKRAAIISAALNPISFFILDFGVLAILALAAPQVNAGTLLQGQVLSFVNYMAQTLLAVGYVANLMVVFTRGTASAERILAVLDTESCQQLEESLQAAESIRELPQGMGESCQFEHIDFTYPDAKSPALSDISLKVEAGQFMGITGATGSGKSTLATIIAGLMQVQNGVALLDDRQYQDYSRRDLSQHISYVAQTPAMLQMSLRDNLRMRNQHASDEELWRALEIAQAKEFVQALPEGLDTQILQDAANFSGGQKQRLCIARALVSLGSILILDGATSALDRETESRFFSALRSAYPEKTIILISERVDYIKSLRSIFVLEQGKMAGYGSHEQLMESCTSYRELVQAQVED